MVMAAVLFLPHKRSTAILVKSGYSIHDYARVLSDTSYMPYVEAVLLKVLPKQKGVYSTGDNLFNLLQNIVKKRQILFKVHLPIGASSQQVANLLTGATGLQGPVPHIQEGSLLADSYTYTYFTSSIGLVKYAQTQLSHTTYKLWLEHHNKTRLSNPDQAIILASIVVKECHEHEYTKVAQVFLNRLDRNIKLESCATVAFITGKTQILFKDLTIPSTYNTYIHTGLPPTPIGLVSRSAIEAVLTADKSSKDMFFVKKTNSNDHIFSKTFQEHSRIKALQNNGRG